MPQPSGETLNMFHWGAARARWRRAALQPFVPIAQSFAGSRRQPDRSNLRIDLARHRLAAQNIEIDMRRKIDLADDHQFSSLEHMRIFERLVVAFGDRENHHFRPFAKIEQSRTDEIANILDHEQRAESWPQAIEPAAYHVGFEVTAGSRINLHRRRAGRLDALGVIKRLLIALYNADWHLVLQIADGAFEQGGLAGAGRTYEIEGEDFTSFEPGAVTFGEPVVLVEDGPFNIDRHRMETGDRGESRGLGCMGMIMIVVRMIVIMWLMTMVMVIMVMIMCMIGRCHGCGFSIRSSFPV